MSEQADVVWIRTTAEVNVGGVDAEVDYVPYPRAEWDALTEDQQEAELVEHAMQALAQIASSGASVVDEDEVPDSYRRAAVPAVTAVDSCGGGS